MDLVGNRWKRMSLLVFGLSLLLTIRAGAVGIDDVVGDWTASVERSGAIQLARLEIREETGKLRATLASELGDAEIVDARIEAGALLLRYDVAIGDRSEVVSLALRPSNGGFSGAVSTGSDELAMQWPIQAARVGSPSESALLAKFASKQSPVPDGVARVATSEATEFLGKWDLAVGRADIEGAPQRKIGLVIVDAGGKIAAAIKLKDDSFQRTIYHVSKIEGGLRLSYGMNLGVMIPFNVDIVTSGEGVKATFTPPNQPTFLSGTGVKVDAADQLGLDASLVAQEPRMELIGMIDDDAQVVGVQDDVVFFQEGLLLTALNVTDPLSVRFARGRLHEKRNMVAVTGSKLSAVNGALRSLEVYDVSDPTATVPIGSCRIPDMSEWRCMASGSLLFAVSQKIGTSTVLIHVIDVSDPSGPVVFSSSEPLKGSIFDVDASDSRLYVAARRMHIVDVTNPRSLKTVSEFEGSRQGIGAIRGVDIVGSIAYIARSMHSDASWLELVDISDPATPTDAGRCRTGGGAQDVAVSGSVAFVADRGNGLVLIDVSDPANLKQCGFFRIAGLTMKVKVVGPLVFLKVTHFIDGKDKLAILRYAP